MSFNVDARGATMESKQSGVKITLPPGACDMPTRITIRFRKYVWYKKLGFCLNLTVKIVDRNSLCFETTKSQSYLQFL